MAYFIRFFSLSFNGIKSSYEKINNSIDESAYLLGYSKTKTFLRNYETSKKKNIYGHIGIYQYKTSILKQFVNLRQSNKEVKYRLEQLRAIDNGINIDVVYTKSKSLGIDTVKDYVEK